MSQKHWRPKTIASGTRRGNWHGSRDTGTPQPATRRTSLPHLSALTSTLAWMIWAMVAVLIVFIVIRVFMIAYIGPINDMLKQM